LRMPWRRFLISNFLGATVWVMVISSCGYLFGRHWEHVARNMKRFDLVAAIVLVIAFALVWWRYQCKESAASPE